MSLMTFFTKMDRLILKSDKVIYIHVCRN